MITLNFEAWKRYYAKRHKEVTNRWITERVDRAVRIFKAGTRRQPKGGVLARRANRSIFRRSKAGEYPAVDSGGLIKSMKSRILTDQGILGTNQPYSKYLREGTPRGQMSRRKMSDNALQESRIRVGSVPRGWVRWGKDK